MDNSIIEKHKELFGRKPNAKSTEETVLEKIREKEPDFVPTQLEEVEQPEPATSEVTSPPKIEDDEPEQVQELVEEIKEAEVIQSVPSRGRGVSKEYRVIFKGRERYFTANVIQSALGNKATKELLEFPEDTDYVADGTINKCKNC